MSETVVVNAVPDLSRWESREGGGGGGLNSKEPSSTYQNPAINLEIIYKLQELSVKQYTSSRKTCYSFGRRWRDSSRIWGVAFLVSMRVQGLELRAGYGTGTVSDFPFHVLACRD